MIHARMLRIALIVVGLLGTTPALAAADFAAQVPEPGSLTLLASGAAALGGLAWLRRRKK